jgi:hypothetical protein
MLAANGESIMGSFAQRRYPNARELLAEVEANRGNETAVLFALHMVEVAFAYVVKECGASYAFDELIHSSAVADALAREMGRKNR